MSKQTIKVKNSGGFWGFAKWLVILIVLSIGLSAIGTLIGSVKSYFESKKIDMGAKTDAIYEENVKEGYIIEISDEEKTDIKENMNSDTAIAIEDIITNMSVYDYRDIVVFVKNRDTKPYNVVFRKTEKGLVLDGMLLSYNSSYLTPSISYFGAKSSAYSEYDYYNFKQLLFFSLASNKSCFSFNDNVSQSVLFNQGVIDLTTVLRGVVNIFSNYSRGLDIVLNKVQRTIFKEFTSFNEKQHIMFDSPDEFSAFYSDVYQSIVSLSKDCLVDYTNSEYVGLYEGNPKSENCKYYTGNSKFVVDYHYFGKKAYSVNTKDYSKGHVFDTDYSVVAYPKITFNLIYDKENTTLSDSELSTHLRDNSLNVQMVLTNIETNETKTFVFNKDNKNYAYLDYVTYRVDLTTEDELLQFDKQSFTFSVDKVVSKVDMKYYYQSENSNNPDQPDGPNINIPIESEITDLSYFDINNGVIEGPSVEGLQLIRNGKLKNIVFPSSYSLDNEGNVIEGNDYNITTIDGFRLCTLVESFYIPNTVTHIGELAFSNCISLVNIEIPDSVKFIDSSAFQGCTKLEKVKLSDNLQLIDEYVFSGCTSLSEITISNTVTKISENAFWDCSSLKQVNFNGTMTDWNSIEIDKDNDYLINTKIICSDGIINK